MKAYREVFDCFIEDFKTYKPLLSAIKNEYEITLGMYTFSTKQFRLAVVVTKKKFPKWLKCHCSLSATEDPRTGASPCPDSAAEWTVWGEDSGPEEARESWDNGFETRAPTSATSHRKHEGATESFAEPGWRFDTFWLQFCTSCWPKIKHHTLTDYVYEGVKK